MARWTERTHEHRTWTTKANGMICAVTFNPLTESYRYRAETGEYPASRHAVTGYAESLKEAKHLALLGAEVLTGWHGGK